MMESHHGSAGLAIDVNARYGFSFSFVSRCTIMDFGIWAFAVAEAATGHSAIERSSPLSLTVLRAMMDLLYISVLDVVFTLHEVVLRSCTFRDTTNAKVDSYLLMSSVVLT
jgi:hypothetical protein